MPVAGRPNVGKSTLVNALCGGKVAIVSDKPQTTRNRISGIVNGDGYQLVLTDLPGFQRPRDALTDRMQRTVERSFEEVDGILFVLSARERIGAGDRFIAERVFALERPVVIALNKVDRLKPGHIVEQMQRASQLGDFHALHPVSALTGWSAWKSPSCAAALICVAMCAGLSRSTLFSAITTGTPSAKTRSAMKRSPAPIRSRADRTKRIASTSSSARSTVRCMRSVSASRGRWKPGRSVSTSW